MWTNSIFSLVEKSQIRNWAITYLAIHTQQKKKSLIMKQI